MSWRSRRVEADLVAAPGAAGRGCRRTCPRPRRSGPSRARISAASSAGDASMNLSGWNSASAASARRSSRASVAVRPTSPVSIAGPLHRVERPVEGLRDRRLEQPLAQPDAELAGQDLDDVPGAVSGSTGASSAVEDRAPCAAGPDAASIAANAAATSGSVGSSAGSGAWPASRRTSPTAVAEVGRAVVGRAERLRAAPATRRDRRAEIAAQPSADRALVRLGERPAGQEHGRDRQLLGRRGPRGTRGEERRLLGGPGGRRDALGDLAPAAHERDGIGFRSMLHRRWFPDHLEGDRVVLRRHVPREPARLPALVPGSRGRPADALPGRADAAPRRSSASSRRASLGPDSLAMGIHVRDTDRLIGSCAFTQLDGDNGSALFHITIGEKDAWGHGYGSEATRLMVDHAFELARPAPGGAVGVRVQRAGDPGLPAGRLRRSRVGRARRSGATAAGGTSSHMSVLEPEWRSTRWQERAARRRPGRARSGAAESTVPERTGCAEAADDAEHRPGRDAARARVPRARWTPRATPSRTPALAADGLDAAFAVGRAREDAGARRDARRPRRWPWSRTTARSSAASAPRRRGSSCGPSPASWTTPEGPRLTLG